MNTFFPYISPVIWANIFGIFITDINLANVSSFGELEYWLAYIKIAALAIFTIMAIGIFVGFLGTENHFIGASVLKSSGGFFSKGNMAVFLAMVIVLVTSSMDLK